MAVVHIKLGDLVTNYIARNFQILQPNSAYLFKWLI